MIFLNYEHITNTFYFITKNKNVEMLKNYTNN